jgi:acylphosphatase
VNANQESGRVRRHVIYHGRVQGVFFRATSFEVSRNFRIVGHVRNRPDGTVELEAEGPASEVERFLDAIADEFSSNIAEAKTTDVPVRDDEPEFRIRY